jgi:exodeoxyribonuclease VIII
MSDTYHKDTTRISKSGLDKIAKAPALYEWKYLKGGNDDDTQTLIFGRAFHDYVLQRDVFMKNYVIKPIFKGIGSRKESEQWDYYHQNKDVVSIKEYEHIIGMDKALRAHPKVAKILRSGMAEKTFNFVEPMTGAPCKIRPDWISDLGYVLDLKSTDDASTSGIKKSVRKYRYYVQDAFYTDGLERNGIIIKGFIFAFVEKKPPYLVNVCVLSPEYVEHGRNTYQDNLLTYMESLETGVWGGYGTDIIQIEMDW